MKGKWVLGAIVIAALLAAGGAAMFFMSEGRKKGTRYHPVDPALLCHAQ